jgi:hypothetical protein
MTCLNERRLFELLCVTSWQPESKFPFSQVRLPSQRVEGARPEFTEGQEAEVYSCSQTGEECGWWKVIIKVTTILAPNAGRHGYLILFLSQILKKKSFFW